MNITELSPVSQGDKKLYRPLNRKFHFLLSVCIHVGHFLSATYDIKVYALIRNFCVKRFFLYQWREILGRNSSKPDVGLEVFKTPSIYLVHVQPVIVHIDDKCRNV